MSNDRVRVAALTATFPCSLCEKPAATIALANDGVVIVEGLIGRTTMRIRAESLPLLRDILARSDAPELYALDGEWASFYCPTCRRSYCADHWHFYVRYEDGEDGPPGWYDCTYGTCPANHTRVVDD